MWWLGSLVRTDWKRSDTTLSEWDGMRSPFGNRSSESPTFFGVAHSQHGRGKHNTICTTTNGKPRKTGSMLRILSVAQRRTRSLAVVLFLQSRVITFRHSGFYCFAYYSLQFLVLLLHCLEYSLLFHQLNLWQFNSRSAGWVGRTRMFITTDRFRALPGEKQLRTVQLPIFFGSRCANKVRLTGTTRFIPCRPKRTYLPPFSFLVLCGTIQRWKWAVPNSSTL